MSEVDQVIAQAGFVPTLALNFATNDTTVLSSFYQFALAPEDEARDDRGSRDRGRRQDSGRVRAEQPAAAIGSETSFRAAFEAAGGELLDWYGYEPALQDFSQPVAALLNVTRSRERHRRLAANLGVPVQFPEARRREDVDMIFVVANARAGTLARVAAALLRRRRHSDVRHRRDLRSRRTPVATTT